MRPCPAALKRIRAFVLGRPAYIVPGTVGDEDRKLAVELGIPLLGPSPEISGALNKKSAARALFRAAEVNVAPGAPVLPESFYHQQNEGGGGMFADYARGKDGWRPRGAAGGGEHDGGDGGDGGEFSGGERIGDEGGEQEEYDEVMALAGLHDGGVYGGATELLREVPPYGDTDPCFDVVEVLARLAVAHPSVSRWIMKVDDESGGRGHAFLDVSGIGELQGVLRKAADALAAMGLGEGGLWGETGGNNNGSGSGNNGGSQEEGWAFLAGDRRVDDALRSHCAVAAAILRRAIASRVSIAAPSAYGGSGSWPRFYAQMMRRGGVVEACPESVTGSPSVNLFIAPTGDVHVLATHEQIFCPAYRFVGASFPQSSVPHAALAAAATAVGEAAARAGVSGFVGVDFVVVRDDGGTGGLRLWAVDLNVRPTCTQASFDLFHFVAGGSFDPSTGTYAIASGRALP